MAALKYLWRSRARFSVGSRQFFKAWLKRMFVCPILISRNYTRFRFRKKGATIDDTAEIGHLRVVGDKKLISIGSFSFVGRAYFACHDKISIGSRVCINDGVQILTASHDVGSSDWSLTKSGVVIEDYVWIGTGAYILPGVKLGRGSVVGAGAVVSKSVEPGVIVVGNPAKPISRTRGTELNYNPCEFLAENAAWLKG